MKFANSGIGQGSSGTAVARQSSVYYGTDSLYESTSTRTRSVNMHRLINSKYRITFHDLATQNLAYDEVKLQTRPANFQRQTFTTITTR